MRCCLRGASATASAAGFARAHEAGDRAAPPSSPGRIRRIAQQTAPGVQVLLRGRGAQHDFARDDMSPRHLRGPPQRCKKILKKLILLIMLASSRLGWPSKYSGVQ